MKLSWKDLLNIDYCRSCKARTGELHIMKGEYCPGCFTKLEEPPATRFDKEWTDTVLGMSSEQFPETK